MDDEDRRRHQARDRAVTPRAEQRERHGAADDREDAPWRAHEHGERHEQWQAAAAGAQEVSLAEYPIDPNRGC
jgi:hypothetical protein